MNGVLVVGAGVIGLTTAITFAESGVPTTIWAADDATATTSYAAGASWGVHLLSPRGRVAAWSAATLDVLRTLATDPATGVRITAGIEASRTPMAPPDWGAPVDGMRECTPEELPPGYVIGWHQRIPIVEMPVYLGYLQARFARAGGVIERRRIASLTETAGVAPVVVNCTGVGASDLTGDRDLVPIRGQVVIVANPGITEFFADGPKDSTDLTYWFPHRDTVLLGGTAVVGDWNRVPDPDRGGRDRGAVRGRRAEVRDRRSRRAPGRTAAGAIGAAAGSRDARRRYATDPQLRPRRLGRDAGLGMRRRGRHRRRSGRTATRERTAPLIGARPRIQPDDVRRRPCGNEMGTLPSWP